MSTPAVALPYEQQKAQFLLKFESYMKKRRDAIGENLKLPDNSGIRAMANDDVAPPNVRGRPKHNKALRLHRKAPTIRQTPKFVQRDSRSPESWYITRLKRPKPAMQASPAQVTNPIYLKAMDAQVERMHAKRVPVYARGFHSDKMFQIRPPTKLETMLGVRREYASGNSNKFQRLINESDSVRPGSRQNVTNRVRNPPTRGNPPRMNYGGGFRGTQGTMVNKLDTAKDLKKVRGYVDNAFIRKGDLAQGFGWANGVTKYARNVNVPENFITKKIETPNNPKRPILNTKQYHSKLPPRPENKTNKANNKQLRRWDPSFGKLAGTIANGGTQGPRGIQPPKKKEVVVRGPARYGTGGAANYTTTLLEKPPVKDGNIRPLIFGVDGLRGPQSAFLEKEAPRSRRVKRQQVTAGVSGRRANMGGGYASSQIMPLYT